MGIVESKKNNVEDSSDNSAEKDNGIVELSVQIVDKIIEKIWLCNVKPRGKRCMLYIIAPIR